MSEADDPIKEAQDILRKYEGTPEGRRLVGLLAAPLWPGQRPLTPYQKIVRAAKAGRGVRLTREDVIELDLDTAIYEAAQNDACEKCLSAGRYWKCRHPAAEGS